MTPARFGYMFDLVLALRVHGVPPESLNLNCFTPQEQAWIRDGYTVLYAELLECSRANNVTDIGDNYVAQYGVDWGASA